MASAQFEIDPGTATFGAPGVAQNVSAAGATVNLRLTSTEGVTQVSWSCHGTHDSSAAAPTITPTGSPLGQFASFVVPAGAGQAYGITCEVNQGYAVTGNASDTSKSAVYVLFANSERPAFITETSESNATHNTVERYNFAIKNAGAIGSVTSVYTRTGAVVAVAGDYDSDEVTNISTVTGATVSDALETNATAIAAVAVTSVHARTGAVVAAQDDYTTALIDNTSVVSGDTLSDALATLNTAVAAAGSGDQIWRPTYGGADPNVHDTFEEAFDAAVATTGRSTIIFDDSLSSDFDTNVGANQAYDLLGLVTLDAGHLSGAGYIALGDATYLDNPHTVICPPEGFLFNSTDSGDAIFRITIAGLEPTFIQTPLQSSSGARAACIKFNTGEAASATRRIHLYSVSLYALYGQTVESDGHLDVHMHHCWPSSGGFVDTGAHGEALVFNVYGGAATTNWTNWDSDWSVEASLVLKDELSYTKYNPATDADWPEHTAGQDEIASDRVDTLAARNPLPQQLATASLTAGAQVDDYNPGTSLVTGRHETVWALDVTGTGGTTAISGAPAMNDAQALTIRNTDATENIVILDEDVGSVAANRFNLGADIIIPPDFSARFVYDSAKWVLVGGSSLTSAVSVGASGIEVLSGVASGVVSIRKIVGTGGITASLNGEVVEIDGSVGGSGEINTVTSLGAGADVYKEKVGADFKLRSIRGLGQLSALASTSEVSVYQLGLAVAATLPSGLGTTSNNLTATNLDIATSLVLTLSNHSVIGGLDTLAFGQNPGLIVNSSDTHWVLLRHEYSTSTAANRFDCHDQKDVAIPPGGSTWVVRSNASRWTVVSKDHSFALDTSLFWRRFDIDREWVFTRASTVPYTFQTWLYNSFGDIPDITGTGLTFTGELDAHFMGAGSMLVCKRYNLAIEWENATSAPNVQFIQDLQAGTTHGVTAAASGNSVVLYVTPSSPASMIVHTQLKGTLFHR